MAVPISPTNDDTQNVNGLLISTSVTGVWNRAIDGTSITPTSSSQNAAAALVGTHIPAEVVVATDPVVLVAGSYGGTVYPLEIGTAGAVGTAGILHTRDVGLGGSVVTHSINVTSGTASLGTGLSSGRKHIEFYNAGTATVYLGNAQVGTANGFPLGTAAYAYFDSSTAWYATIAGAAGTSALRVLEMS